MTAILLHFLPYIVGVIVAVFGAWKLRQSGVKAERLRQVEREADARDMSDQVDNDVGALPGGVARKELGKWSKD